MRDRLLARPTNDIDMACEGNVKKLGEKLSGKLESDFIYHPAFRTCTIQSPLSLRIDIARTRRESYPRKGELPRVSPAGIEEDLYRRDFTINAIAQSLNPEDYGRFIDPLDGSKDVEQMLIRIIHKDSFTDDPTRIFRAVRYAERLGFKIEPETLTLLRKNVTRIDALSGERLLYELRCIARESKETRVRIISRLNSLKAMSFLGIPITSPSLSQLSKIDETETCEFLCLFLSYYKDSKLLKLPLSKECLSTIKTLRLSSEILTKMKNMRKPSAITFHLNNFDKRALRILSKVSPGSPSVKIDRYLKTYIDIKISTTGEDLKKIGIKPGPRYKKILNELLKAKLDGLIKGKRQEIRMVKMLVLVKEN